MFSISMTNNNVPRQMLLTQVFVVVKQQPRKTCFRINGSCLSVSFQRNQFLWLIFHSQVVKLFLKRSTLLRKEFALRGAKTFLDKAEMLMAELLPSKCTCSPVGICKLARSCVSWSGHAPSSMDTSPWFGHHLQGKQLLNRIY